MRRSRLLWKAGLCVGLPFLFVATPVCANPADGFLPFSSTCIDLAKYETNRNELTVRFTNGKRTRFYKYSAIPLPVWTRMVELGRAGKGVGKYFVETVVNEPNRHPFVVIEIPMKPEPAENNKAGDSG